jgi:hypothetical protein
MIDSAVGGRANSEVAGVAVARRAAELRAAQEACEAAGADEDCLEPVCEYNRFWNEGVEAFDGGIPIGDCPHAGPSAEQDDWLRGWLTAQAEMPTNPTQDRSVADPRTFNPDEVLIP